MAHGQHEFYSSSDEVIREIVRECGFDEDVQEYHQPNQGVNNRTYFVNLRGTQWPDLVIKIRPEWKPELARRPVSRNNPFWPSYTQALFGRFANGGLGTLPIVAEKIAAHGVLGTPRIHCVDQTFRLVPASYVVSDYLVGTPLDWDGSQRFTPNAAWKLGQHLARMHQSTGQNSQSFGIFDRSETFPANHWWERFGAAYHLLFDLIARRPHSVAELQPALSAALRQAQATGAPDRFPLICLDQAPDHMSLTTNGAVYRWWILKGAYELAMVDIWIGGGAEKDALHKGYAEVMDYPLDLMEATRPAYQLMTWMEWMYCNYVLLRQEKTARALEPELRRLCEPFSTC